MNSISLRESASSPRKRLLGTAILALALSPAAWAQAIADASAVTPEAVPAAVDVPAVEPKPAPAAAETPQDKRIMGVLPNYRTADGTAPFHPISSKYKLTIAAKDSFDGPNYVIGGI